MKCRIFTLLFAFLAIAGNAVWGQSTSNNTITINGTTVNTDSSNRWSYESNKDGSTDNNVLEIKVPGTYIIESTGTSHATTNNNTNVQILIQTAGEYYITLKNVRTDAQLNETFAGTLLYPNHCAFQIGDDSKTKVTVELDWEGSNKFWSGAKRAGINVKPGAKLILNDKNPENGDSLEAGSLCNSGENSEAEDTYGAGIGGDFVNPNFGTIIIENGTVLARCESKGDAGEAYAAGIGGGYSNESPNSSTEGTIIIKGGDIEAASWSVEEEKNYADNKEGNEYAYGAGIGGGYKGTCTNIAILGGEVVGNAYTDASNKRGNDIGVGYEYEDGITNGIIIGQWNKDTKPTLPEGIDINETNYFNGLTKPDNITEGYKNEGEVTMPEGTQLYYGYPINEEAKFYAYNFKLDKNMFAGEENHSITSKTEYGNRKFYYYGANMSFTEGALSCSLNHLFLGWYDADATISIVPIKDNDNATFETSKDTPTSLTIYEYDAVWVDNEMDVTVRIGTTWAGQPGDHTPKVEYVPTNLDVSNLTFSLSTYDGNTAMPSEFEDLKFVGNQLQGKVNLQGDDTYKKIVIKAKVKLGNDGEEKETTINVVIVDEYMINTASVDLNKKHVYNGQLHNGTSGTEMDDWVLDVKMTKDIIDGPLDEPAPLREGTHYRIYQYTYNNGTPKTASDGDEETLPIKNAGTYSNITIQAINDAFFDFTLDPQQTGKYTLTGTGQVITVAQREMNVLLKAEATSLDELNQLKESNDINSLVNFEEMEGIRGLVEGEEPEISGTISSVEKKDGSDNIYLVTIDRSSFKIGESISFLPSNYKMTVGSEELTDEGKMPEGSDEDIVIEVEISGNNNDNTGGNIHIDRPKKYYHIYIDTVCPGLHLELSKDSVIEGGQVSVYLTIEEQCDTTGFTFEYKRGLNKWWQDLKPLEGVQPGEYIIKNIYSDIYIQALDAILLIEEEPTGIEDVEGVKVYAQDGNIYVYTPNRERVIIVSMNGALVKNAEQEGMQSYSVSRGIYIVRIGDKVFKIKN